MANYYYGKITFYGKNILKDMIEIRKNNAFSFWLEADNDDYVETEDPDMSLMNMRILFPFNYSNMEYGEYLAKLDEIIETFSNPETTDSTKKVLAMMSGVGRDFQLDENLYTDGTPADDFPVVIAIQCRSRELDHDFLELQFDWFKELERLEYVSIYDGDGTIERTVYARNTTGGEPDIIDYYCSENSDYARDLDGEIEDFDTEEYNAEYDSQFPDRKYIEDIFEL